MKRLVVVLLVAPLLLARADEIDDMKAAGAPDDIIAIMRKMKAGTPPSADDLTKLRNWQRGIGGRVNAPSPQTGTQFGPKPTGPTPEGIRVRVEFHATAHEQGPDWTSDLETDGWADAMMYPAISGSDDYRKSILDPNVKASSFRFEPIVVNGQIVKSGGGHLSYKYRSKCYQTITATYASTTFSTMFVTTGRDDHLLGLGGGFAGTLDGTRVGCDETKTLHEGPMPNDVQLPFVAETLANNHPPPANSPTPASQFTMSYKAMVDAVASGKPTTVTGTEPFDVKIGDGTKASGTSTMKIMLRPRELQLVIEPTDTRTYEQWLPMPDVSDGADKAIFGDHKPLSVHVVLAKPSNVKTGPTKPDSDVTGKIEINLHDVSTHKGVAMNYPALGKGDSKPDVFFLPQKYQASDVKIVDETHAETVNPALETTVLVAARDTGAYGMMSAQVKALALSSINRRDNTPDLALPLDDNHNYIADAWEDAEGILRKNLPPTWDEEAVPAGMKTTGDNMSLFDQYRGVVVTKDATSEEHRRISPKQRTLFYFPAGADKELYREGAALYAQAMRGVAVFALHFPTRLAPSGDPGEAVLVPRWVNFNTTKFSTTAKVYSVWLEDVDKPWDGKMVAAHPGSGDREADGSVPGGNTFGSLKDEQYVKNHMSPATTKRINISRATFTKFISSQYWPYIFNTDGFVAASKALGIDPKAFSKTLLDHNVQAPLIDELVVFSVMHELGHATGAIHHDPEVAGDVACPMLYWQSPAADTKTFVGFLAKKWNPRKEAPGSKPWRFCNVDYPNMTFKP